jgi:hypothetical protein
MCGADLSNGLALDFLNFLYSNYLVPLSSCEIVFNMSFIPYKQGFLKSVICYLKFLALFIALSNYISS